MNIVIPGGAGHLGQELRRHFEARGDDVTVLSRSGAVRWDGKSQGDWVSTFEGADVVINLAGRSVNCRYSKKNLDEMMASRVDSTRAVGLAIAKCKNPPKLWIQSSTATIYAHRFDAPNDDRTGIIGSETDGMPKKWLASVEIAKAWEAAMNESITSATRTVAIRSAMVMSPVTGSIFDVLCTLTRRGLMGTQGDGRQYVSWIHESDFSRAIDWIIDHDELSGPVNMSSPNPLPQREFAAALRQALGIKIGLPAMAWMLEIGAFAMGSETELLLKSRRVIPSRLLEMGFEFVYPYWDIAAKDLAGKMG